MPHFAYYTREEVASPTPKLPRNLTSKKKNVTQTSKKYDISTIKQIKVSISQDFNKVT